MNLVVDLNADLGEGAGHDEEILDLVSSANIACGFHAGDPASIFASIQAAIRLGVSIGAHPSFPDRQNFGRSEMTLPAAEIYSTVSYQIGAFQGLTRAAGGRMNHVKHHGALYNMAARDRSLAELIVNATVALDPKLFLFAPSRSELASAAAEIGLEIAAEIFADRNYLPDGSLVPRSDSRAFVHDPVEAADRITFRTSTYVARRDSYLRQRLPAYGISSHSANTAKQPLPRSRDGKRRTLEHDAGRHYGGNK